VYVRNDNIDLITLYNAKTKEYCTRFFFYIIMNGVFFIKVRMRMI